ncbi:uncharacterized protein BDR25DRAFT_102712 [Lindgomyces ingoldianus]|uniref:Uncharacterized protein n=1 Tax=Lindgomyces ingoldianus TaxID=673940 RepID=A0ACB6R8F9_9PLEO|nr:uncharacterized protein BDR25DRAFT_102712 [Lindgomyces ingoldianus]KAF2475436.1 hypothetical protein BDR25DRAFT_102712 [Lindgomyces ingoldianus]
MMASKRLPATPNVDREIKKVRWTSLTCPPANPLTMLNAEESPFLKLPAELRNHIYELLLGGHFIHVEGDKRTDSCKTSRPYNEASWAEFAGGGSNLLSSWGHDFCLHFYSCKAQMSEDEAFRRSRDASLNERLSGSEGNLNYWRLGDPFHVDSCTLRHQACYPEDDYQKPAWMMTPRDSNSRTRPNVSLNRTLNLTFLQTSRQVYQEAKKLPFFLNTFGFRNVLALLFFLFRLEPFQGNALATLWIYLRAGRSFHSSDARSWNQRLFAPSLLSNLQGLRVVHISISIAHTGMGDRGPLRSEFYEPHLNSWVLGLSRLRGLPLERVTVIISDDPASKFGIDGYSDRVMQYGWNFNPETWLLLREQECFSAEEKRQWAERLRQHILKETTDM